MDARQVKEFVQIAQASYADFWPSDEKWRGGTSGNLVAKLRTKSGAFTAEEASAFSTRYELVHQFIEDGLSKGFGATLFADKQSGKLVFSIRGTEPRDAIRDFLVTDLRIGFDGYASPQVIPLYRYFKQLTTPAGQAVSYSQAEIARLRAVHFDQYLAITVASGGADRDWQPLQSAMLADKGIDAGQGVGVALIGGASTVDVVGHSLGGHLAILMDRLFPSKVRQILTLNAPGFDEAAQAGYSETLLAMFSPSWNSGRILRVEADGDGVSKLGSFRPGTRYAVGQETLAGLLASFNDNHSAVNSVDGLAVAEALGKFDGGIAADARHARAFIDAASNTPERSYEALIGGLRKIVSGASTVSIATGVDPATRDALYLAMTDIANSNVMSALAAGSSVSTSFDPYRARTDFGSLVSLSLGATLQLRTDSAPVWVALGQVHGSLYASWNEDVLSQLQRKDPDALNFTDAWLADRGAMLSAIVAKNIRNESYDMATTRDGLLPQTAYLDLPTNIALTTGVVGLKQVAFGGEGADVVGGHGLADRLYGGGGNDNLAGGSGADSWRVNSATTRSTAGRATTCCWAARVTTPTGLRRVSGVMSCSTTTAWARSRSTVRRCRRCANWAKTSGGVPTGL